MPPKQGELVGSITHYFPKIGVGVIELSGSLKVGDSIKIQGANAEFEQVVESMESNNQKIQEAGSGEEIGLKLNSRAPEGSQVYKL